MGVTEARVAMLAAVSPLVAERVPLSAALNRMLSDEVIDSHDQLPFAVSAMNGYALRRVDTSGILRIRGESSAWRGYEGCCESGAAIRISTGAAMPDGADTVVI